MAVKAAEQIYGDIGMVKEKFAYVKAWVQEKFDISDTELKNIIESAVYELNKVKKGDNCFKVSKTTSSLK